jgi:hypothetical protein
MDCNKLQNSDTIYYLFKHPNAVKHVQNIYDENFTVNPKNIIKPVIATEKIIADKNKIIKQKISVESLIITEPVIVEEESTIVVSEKSEHSEPAEIAIVESTGVTSVTEADVKPVDAWSFMVSIIDDTSSLYTPNMWRDAIDSMKQKLIVFMTSGAGHKKYGPKKSRTILAWLTDNKRGTPASSETALVIAHFISWLLNTTVSSIETAKEIALWIMFRKRGMWMIRANI